jgi:hypothetical protein
MSDFGETLIAVIDPCHPQYQQFGGESQHDYCTCILYVDMLMTDRP